ncbi:MAG: permease [bacterium]
MNWKNEWKSFAAIIGGFLLLLHLPIAWPRFDEALIEALALAKYYAQGHVLATLIPAFFIAGAIGVFVSKGDIMRYLGPSANKFLAYGVASVSGTILSVCSCTVLPLFAGIYRRGAGLGPAIAFLYSGPAINVLAITLTARVLGWQIGLARALGAIGFSIFIGLVMSFIFRHEEISKTNHASALEADEEHSHHPWQQTSLYFLSLVAILIFANWGGAESGFFAAVHRIHWLLTGIAAIGLAVALVAWFGAKLWKVIAAVLFTALTPVFFPHRPEIAFIVGIIGLTFVTSTEKGEPSEWFQASWNFVKQIAPLLLIGILITGFLFGGSGSSGLVPSEWVTAAVGGNSLSANFISAILSAFMYFCTLIEVPVVQGLMNAGMGKGPALALLLAGPALSLPSMLALRAFIGTKKTVVYISLVVVMATLTGWIFGMMVG